MVMDKLLKILIQLMFMWKLNSLGHYHMMKKNNGKVLSGQIVKELKILSILKFKLI
jgi:hypothetical protein